MQVVLQIMKKSENVADYFVLIRNGDREISLFKFDERWKADFHVAELNHVLHGGPKPNILEFGPPPGPKFRAMTVFLNATVPDFSGVKDHGKYSSLEAAAEAMDREPMPTPIDFDVLSELKEAGDGYWLAHSHGCIFFVQRIEG